MIPSSSMLYLMDHQETKGFSKVCTLVLNLKLTQQFIELFNTEERAKNKRQIGSIMEYEYFNPVTGLFAIHWRKRDNNNSEKVFITTDPARYHQTIRKSNWTNSSRPNAFSLLLGEGYSNKFVPGEVEQEDNVDENDNEINDEEVVEQQETAVGESGNEVEEQEENEQEKDENEEDDENYFPGSISRLSKIQLRILLLGYEECQVESLSRIPESAIASMSLMYESLLFPNKSKAG
jgi:hypothetical protein